MRFVDQVIIVLEAGNGGRGCISFRREAYVPFGGPDGGDGGAGGSIVLVADANVGTLLDYRYRRRYHAQDGAAGEGSNRTGRGGADTVLKVPQGTLVYDDATGEQLGDLVESGTRLAVARGGIGGRGNYRFRSPSNQAPRRADAGRPGERRRLRLELKLLADVGLVGFPNAGKSTLLSRLTSARPKIADYPFTTLTPNLGIVDLGDYMSCTMADIPGLIEGASEGKGLGHAFLRHIERTRLLIFVLDVTDEPAGRYRALCREVETYTQSLVAAPRLVCLNKIDLWPAEDPLPVIPGEIALPISCVTGAGLPALRSAIKAAFAARRQQA
jgi:GTP-binding protein